MNIWLVYERRYTFTWKFYHMVSEFWYRDHNLIAIIYWKDNNGKSFMDFNMVLEHKEQLWYKF